MFKKIGATASLVTVGLIGGLLWPAMAPASERTEATQTIQKADQAFQQIMQAPDKRIPNELLESAKCVAIIPGELKFAFVLGGQYGRGLAMCRTANGWSAPVFIAVEGGSVGYQIGGSSTDLVLLFMNDDALHHLLNSQFKLGASASAAAGPVGRHASASTDISMHAEILSYSRSRGIFAGADLNGTVVKADRPDNQAMYGANVTRQQIIDGNVPKPAAAQPLAKELTRYAKP